MEVIKIDGWLNTWTAIVGKPERWLWSNRARKMTEIYRAMSLFEQSSMKANTFRTMDFRPSNGMEEFQAIQMVFEGFAHKYYVFIL